MLIEVGSLWTNKRGDYVVIVRLGPAHDYRHIGGNQHQMIYWQRISGPAYQHTLTKGVSSAYDGWFVSHYTFAEPAIHIEEEENGAHQEGQ